MDVNLSTLGVTKNKFTVQLTLDYDGSSPETPSVNHQLYVKNINIANNSVDVASFGEWGQTNEPMPFVNWCIRLNISS